ncbi:acyl-CoA-binding domain-containing protein [Ketobacter sp.]|uniref:acyl-CoA-binding domain-containing protein n=1 Tax=Ketobacter sp. TaxID=2083498 RepID=UPI0025C50822|nr:acyl-CoA-binding protein [Ketobacter sp.]
MGKLADMVSEDLSWVEKMRINLRKVGLAGVGLVSIMDSERTKLYRQIMELGAAYGGSDTVVGRISLLGTGTVNLVLEESQRVFDDLVAEGEQALNRNKAPVEKPVPRKIHQPRPVAKTPLRPESASVAKKPVAVKAKAPSDVQPPNVQPPLSAAMKSRLEQVANRLAGASLSPQQQLEIMALTRQVESGDVKGRRPSKAKPAEQAEFDARKGLKGMKPEEAIKRLELLSQRLAPEVVS